jgi:hypothetical protein
MSFKVRPLENPSNTTSITAPKPNCPERVIRARMQRCLDRLGIPLEVVWVPKPDADKHGEILSRSLLIYDVEEADAWETFTHELVEYKLKEVTQVYRTLVNQLIDGYEKLAYQQKERFIDFLPKLIEALKESRV